LHTGVELETFYQPVNWARLDVAGSYNFWEYKNDVSATYQPDEGSSQVQTINLYVDGLKVGNAPQTQFAYTLNLKPSENFDVTFVGTSFLRYWSDFDPLTRTDASDRGQTWQVPNYTVFNLHLNYTMPSVMKGSTFFINLFNLFDATYIQDAVDNSQYNGYSANGTNHSADDAEVFFGLPRRYNFGVRINF
jgi:outer membrane receptor for Fe3+-dicitrate